MHVLGMHSIIRLCHYLFVGEEGLVFLSAETLTLMFIT